MLNVLRLINHSNTTPNAHVNCVLSPHLLGEGRGGRGLIDITPQSYPESR